MKLHQGFRIETLFHCKSHTLKNLFFRIKKVLKAGKAKCPVATHNKTFFKKYTRPTILSYLKLNKEFQIVRHTFKNCINLGTEGFIGWTSKMSRCNTEPDFLLETYQLNYVTLIEAELRVSNSNLILFLGSQIEKLHYSWTKRF